MDKQNNRYNEQEYLNDFIDELIMECKPTPPPNLDQDTAAMLETVRSVKRLRSDEVSWEWTKEKQKRSGSSKIRRQAWVKWLSAAAVIFLIAGFIQMQDQQDDADFLAMDSAPEEMAPRTMMEMDNGTFAFVAEAYQMLDNYVGTMEVAHELDDESWEETVEITYQKPNQFVSVKRVEDGEPLTRIYDGGRFMVSYRGEESDEITIEAIGPEALDFYLSDYHLGTMLEEIRNAPDVNLLGHETINGHSVTVYEYRYDPEQPFNRVWVDEHLQLPLKQEVNHSNGDSMTREFTSLSVDVDLDESVFSFNVEDADKIHFASAEAEEAWERTEDSEDVSMAMTEVTDGISTATVFNLIDSYYLELNLLGAPYGLQEFRLAENVREKLARRPLKPGQLVSIQFHKSEEQETLVINRLNRIDQVVVEGFYQGALDSQFVEVVIEEHPRVLAVGKEAVDDVRKLSEKMAEVNLGGILVRITIEASDMALNGEITELVVLDERMR